MIGGGAMGCSIAHFLRTNMNPPGVMVAERAPTYARTSTPWASGGVCRLGNAIIGLREGRCPNFLMAAGFSGRGQMHAPGVGRAIAELILNGGYRTIGVARLGWSRVELGEPDRERGIL